ncbi:hypothetical protein RND71_026191 [Anisodus tanguticus]|uniref:Uncharacterized protein n=1 Tax=Anisodus tanguticus TaxID=243964 RepID=A0AAE1RN16_9SOLA|nr:hypothetical protein RND71_026191 [Anisodus tanguticus]
MCLQAVEYLVFASTFLVPSLVHSPFSALLSKDAKILRPRQMGFTNICRSCHDLVLQKKITSSQTLIYRIKCDQLRDVFPIPNPQNPSLCITLEASFDLSKVSMSTTHILDWNDRLSFGQLLKDELHVLDKKSLCKYDIYTVESWTSKLLSNWSTMTDAELVALTIARIPFFKAYCRN